jgi:hypothetical protein
MALGWKWKTGEAIIRHSRTNWLGKQHVIGWATSAIDSVNETRDSVTRKPFGNEAYRGIGGEMVKEQQHDGHIFIDMRKRDFWGLIHERVSRHRVARNRGTDIRCNF